MPSLLQKNKRRSKRDKTGRNYICGCGKNYLSYPALYTHIKNKHEGVSPSGTTLQPQSRVKPGRPPKKTGSPSRRSDNDSSGNEEDGDMSQRGSDRPSGMSNLEYTPVRNLEDRFRHFPLRKELLSLEDLEIVRELGCLVDAEKEDSEQAANPTESFLKDKNFITSQYILHPIVEIINSLQSESTDDSFYQHLTCDKVFALYLFNLSKFTTQVFYDMVSMIIRGLQQCLNDLGYDLLQKFARQNPSQKIELMKESADSNENLSFCKTEPAWYICICFDYFVKDFLGHYLPGQAPNVSFVCVWLQSFNEWMVKYNLSKIKCSFFSFYN